MGALKPSQKNKKYYIFRRKMLVVRPRTYLWKGTVYTYGPFVCEWCNVCVCVCVCVCACVRVCAWACVCGCLPLGARPRLLAWPKSFSTLAGHSRESRRFCCMVMRV